MGFFIDNYQDFRGNVMDLVDLATRCTNFMNLPGDLEKINERTVRYYVTEGLVDKPLRIGRDAEYSYHHLLQFLASRYLVSAGYPIAKVAPYVSSKSDFDLEQMLRNPSKPNLAELLVASYAREPSRRLRESLRDKTMTDQHINLSHMISQKPDFLEKRERFEQKPVNPIFSDESVEKLKIEIRELIELTRVKTRQTHREMENLFQLQAECRERIKELQELMINLQESSEKKVRQLEDKLDELMKAVKQGNQ